MMISKLVFPAGIRESKVYKNGLRTQEYINKVITNMVLYNNMTIEEKLKDLIINGCSCGNKDIEKFTLIFKEGEFSHIQCEVCDKHIYPIGTVITQEMMKKWLRN